VQVSYVQPDGTAGTYTARVEVSHTIETKYSTARADTHAYPQYALTALEQRVVGESGAVGW
jgi:hypothetical protein